MPVEASEKVSLLAIAWDRKVQVAKLVKSEMKIYGKWTLESSVIGVAWLDDQRRSLPEFWRDRSLGAVGSSRPVLSKIIVQDEDIVPTGQELREHGESLDAIEQREVPSPGRSDWSDGEVAAVVLAMVILSAMVFSFAAV
ncbi:hypothetical protein U1Q18_040282 [Sarracenia purpurea var. burkii]